MSFYDFLIGIMVFLLAFTILNTIWTINYRNATGTIATTEMEAKSLQALNALLKTKGYPENWNPSNVEIIGLCSKKNTIDETKLAAFLALDYQTAKTKMKLEGYDFYFEFKSQGLTTTLGVPPTPEKNTVSLKRLVEFKGENAIVEFKTFR
ncbi:MAG: hypothetical protein QXK06_00860 [Candidatus Diapherotrites archaeon]